MVAAIPRARTALCALAAVSSLAWCNLALAVDKVACVQAAEAGQRLQKDGHLVSARDRLLVCASLECPDVVSQDCTGWLGEVQRSLASVIVKAHDPRGEPLRDVNVFLDGARLSERTPTAAIDVDPGDHVLRCERVGYSPAERPVRLSEGERGNEVDCRLAPIAPSEPWKQRVDPQVFEPVPQRESSRGPVPWLVWPLGGLGVVGIAGFAYFGITGEADQNSTRARCAPYCKPADVNPIQTKFVIADVSLGVGAVALGAAALVALLQPGPGPTKSVSGARTSPQGVIH